MRSRKRNFKPTILKSRLIASSWRLELFEDELRFRGRPPFHYVRTNLPDSAVVFAKEEGEKIPLIRQYRPGARRFFWEFPAGFLERGETPIDCIKREFREEVGRELLKAKVVGSFYLQPSRSNQLVHVFTGKVGKNDPLDTDSNENLECEFFTKRKVWELLSERPSAIHILAFLMMELGARDFAKMRLSRELDMT